MTVRRRGERSSGETPTWIQTISWKRGTRKRGTVTRGSGGGQEKKLEQHDGQRALSGWQEGLEINWGLVGVWGTAGAPRLVSNLPVRGSFNTAAKPGRVHRSSDGILSARRFSKSVLKVLRGGNMSGSGQGYKFWCFKTFWWIVGLACNMWAWSVDLSFFLLNNFVQLKNVWELLMLMCVYLGKIFSLGECAGWTVARREGNTGTCYLGGGKTGKFLGLSMLEF